MNQVVFASNGKYIGTLRDQEVAGSNPVTPTCCKALPNRELRLPDDDGNANENEITTLVLLAFRGGSAVNPETKPVSVEFPRCLDNVRSRRTAVTARPDRRTAASMAR